jgi:hypothetical protein
LLDDERLARRLKRGDATIVAPTRKSSRRGHAAAPTASVFAASPVIGYLKQMPYYGNTKNFKPPEYKDFNDFIEKAFLLKKPSPLRGFFQNTDYDFVVEALKNEVNNSDELKTLELDKDLVREWYNHNGARTEHTFYRLSDTSDNKVTSVETSADLIRALYL